MIGSFAVGKRLIHAGVSVYIIAELSANHNRNFEQAVELIHAAKEAGADAIKLQTYTPDTLTIKSSREPFQIKSGTIWDGKTLYDLYSEAYTPWDWQPKLKILANDLGMDLFSTAFDPTAVDFLEEMGTPIHKIASFEIVDIPLIEKMAHTGKPLIISTGMATLGEIEEAVNAARNAGASHIALLKCTSGYPAEPEEMNLHTIPVLAEAFQVPVGLSDHTLGIAVPIAAVALGACIVEKHLTLSRSILGPDSAFSLEPTEFTEMVRDIRITEKALGSVRFSAGPDEQKHKAFRRSLFTVRDIQAGEELTRENVRSIRPANGLPPRYLEDLLGCRARRSIVMGTPLSWDLVDCK